MDPIENRLNSVEESVKMIARYVKKEIDNSKSGSDSVTRTAIMNDVDKKFSMIDKSVSVQFAKLEEMINKSGKTLTDKGMQQYIDKINSMRDELNSALKKMEMFKREVDEIETRGTDSGALQASIKSMTNKLILLEGRLGSFVTTADLDNFRKSLRLDRIDQVIDDHVEKKSEKLIDSVKEAQSKFDYIEKEFSRIKDYQEDVETRNKAFEDDAQRIEQRLRTLEVTKGAVDTADLKGVLKEMREMRSRIEQESMGKASMDKNLQDISYRLDKVSAAADIEYLKKLGSDVNELKKAVAVRGNDDTYDTLRRMNTDVQTLKKNMDKITRDNDFFMKNVQNKIEIIEAARPDDLHKIGSTVDRYSKIIDEKDKTASAMMKKIADMESKMKSLEISIGSDESIKGSGKDQIMKVTESNNMAIASLSKNLHDVEKELEKIKEMKGEKHSDTKDMSVMVNKLVVKNFEEFAKVMDRKMPHLMTREEHVKHMEDLNRKIGNIQAPDLTGLARRIDMVESKLSEISSFMKGMYDKMPIVVE